MELQGLRYTKSADEPMKEMMFVDGTGNHVQLCALGNIGSYPVNWPDRDYHPLIGQTGMFAWGQCLPFVTCNLIILYVYIMHPSKEGRTAVAIQHMYICICVHIFILLSYCYCVIV